MKFNFFMVGVHVACAVDYICKDGWGGAAFHAVLGVFHYYIGTTKFNIKAQQDPNVK